MEANWIEIKRFLNDYRKNIVIGSTVIAILFAVAIYLVGTFKGEVLQEGKEDFEVDSEALLNEAQPAYFQIYVEYEDGTAYGNPAIINQYFNLNSVKEQIKNDTGIDIKSIEEEVYLNDLTDEIEIINVTRNDSSYLLTATFNLGNEQDNLIVAEYYYNLLYSEEFSILTDKKTYVFQEPILAKKSNLEQNSKEIEEQRKKSDDYSLVNDVLIHFRNIIIGLLLGIVTMIGIFLLKEIFGKRLNYSFTYELEEDEKFILYDTALQNEKIISQFVSTPHASHKIVVSEKSINKKNIKLLSENKQVSFKNSENKKILLTEIQSLSELDLIDDISEVIIIVYPQITTRKWYKTQKQFLEINALPVKIIQINE